MKILNEENERIVRCEDCDTKIQYEKEDIKYGEFGITRFYYQARND